MAALALDVADLAVGFPPDVAALDGLTWAVPAGSSAAVLGPNGCGKSTLLRVLAGYQFPHRGAVSVLGERFGAADLQELRRRIGVVDASSPWLFGGADTVADAVATGFGGHLATWRNRLTDRQAETTAAALAAVGLSAQSGRPFATLSAGQARRALLARALVGEPELLLLDEPTSGLDLPGREGLLATLAAVRAARPGLTVVTVTHALEELAPDTSAVLLLAAGRAVAAGPPDAVLTEAHLSAAFGLPVRVARLGDRWAWAAGRGAWAGLAEG